MQQYSVPQFVEFEDKIIGPFTLRQFAVLLGGGIFILFLWGLFDFGILFWLFSIPSGVVTLFISIGSLNGRPVLSHVFPLMSYFRQPKRLIFQRVPNESIITKKVEVKDKSVGLTPLEVQSRLRRLSYVLDQKLEQEEVIKEKTDSIN